MSRAQSAVKLQVGRSSTPEFRSACRKALRRAGNLAAIGRDRIIADLRLQFDHAGQYVAFVDRIRLVDRTRRLSREVLAHNRSLSAVQHVVEGASVRDQTRIVVAYVDADETNPQLTYELRGR